MTITWKGQEVFALDWLGRGPGGGLFVRLGPWEAMLFNEEVRYHLGGRIWERSR